MHLPQPGDILIRDLTTGHYDLVDAVSLKVLDGPFENFAMALAAARLRNVHAMWQQSLDTRGRPLGDPIRLPV